LYQIESNSIELFAASNHIIFFSDNCPSLVKCKGGIPLLIVAHLL